MMTNEELAHKLRTQAAALSRAGDNMYRIRAFRQATMAVLALREPAADVLANAGPAELARRARIGRSIAETIAEYVTAGHAVGKYSVRGAN